MKIILTALTLALAVPVFAQDCDYEIDEKDEFTGEFKRMVNAKFPHGLLEFYNDNGTYTMVLTYNNANLGYRTEAKGGDTMILKLANDEMITLTCLDVEPSGKDKKPTLYTVPTYELSEEQITLLSEHEITMARIDFNGETIDVDTTKNGGKIKEGAQCIIK